jgi:hypothetical protein
MVLCVARNYIISETSQQNKSGKRLQRKEKHMVRHKWLTVAIVVVVAMGILAAGCKKDEETTTSAGTTPTAPTAPTISNYSGATPVNVLALVRVSVAQTIPGVGTIFVDANVGSATFGTPGQDKGDVKVTVGTTDYPFIKSSGATGVTYSVAPPTANPQGVPLNAGATSVTFNATGYALAPAAVTVPGQLNITAPDANASVPRTSNLTVTWTMSGGSGTQSAIFISDAAGHSVFKQGLGNVTSGTFTAAELDGLNAGTAFLYAISYNYVLANSNAAVLVGEATALRTITLQ